MTPEGTPAEVARLYDRWAGTYDTDDNRTRDLAGEVLRRALAGRTWDTVLELGCGTGRNTGWLAERASRVIAVDLSREMLEVARARISAPGVRFVRHDVTRGLPLADGAADLIVITLVLEHVEALAPVFESCARVLRPGGELFACELHPVRQARGVVARFTERERTVRLPAFEHSVEDFVEAAARAGLGAVETEGHAGEGDEESRLLSLRLA